MLAAISVGPLQFEHPQLGLLLLSLPLVIYLGTRSLGGLDGIRRALALALRCVVVALLVAALAGPTLVRQITDQVVVFAVDLSASIPRMQREIAEAFLRAATGGARPERDLVAVVSFAADAQVEQLPRSSLEVSRLAGPNRADATNLGAALRLAQALFPPNFARRIVLLSDGNENVGDVRAMAAAAGGAGIPVDVLPLQHAIARDVQVESVAAPTTARLEETVALGVTLRATAETSGRLWLYHNDSLVDLDPAGPESALAVTLAAGLDRRTLSVPLRSAGAHRFRVEFVPDSRDDDSVTQNNEGRAFTLVSGPQRVLVLGDLSRDPVHVDRAAADALVAALQREQFACDLEDVASFRITPEGLSAYGAVVLSNVSAAGIGPEGERVLAACVREVGLGLIMIGGDQSFTVGGFHDSPVGEILPVETSRQKLQLPALGQVIVLDRSGSMTGLKLEQAKRAARGAVELLHRRDWIGVVAFDSAADWIVPLQRCDRPDAVQRAIGAVGPGGGTDLYPALSQAIDALVGSDAALRHIILLTDGQTTPRDFDRLAGRMAEARITCSSVAIGAEVDAGLLTMLASRTGGRTYFVRDARAVPQIFARETVLAGRAALYERPFTPRISAVGQDAVLSGLRQADLPPLEGHVIVTARPLAVVALDRPSGDGPHPILAYWHVGLGRSVAFTSGMWPRWGPAWTAWPGFSALWAQVLRWAARPPASDDFEVTSRVLGDRIAVVLEARSAAAAQRGALRWTGRMLDPGLAARDVEVRQSGPGRYEANFDAPAAGTYFLDLAFAGDDAAGGGLRGVVRTGVTVPYAREYAAHASNPAAMFDIARLTGGRVLDARRPAEVFEAFSVRPVEARQPAWELLVRLALLLYLADVAVRRLALNPRIAAARVRQWLKPAPAVAADGATLGALRDARERVRSAAAAPQPRRATGAAAERVDPAVAVARERPESAATSAATDRYAADRAGPPGVDAMQRLRAARDRAREVHERGVD